MSYDITGQTAASQAVATAVKGPLAIGWTLHIMFFGVFIGMLIDYWTAPKYKLDTTPIKLVIWTVVVLNCFETVHNFKEVFHGMVSQNRSTLDLVSNSPLFAVQPLFTGATGFIVHILLSMRVIHYLKIESKRKAFQALMCFSILLAFIGSMLVTGYGIVYFEGPPDSTYMFAYQDAMGVWLWGSALTNLFLMIGLAYAYHSNAKFSIPGRSTLFCMLSGLIRVNFLPAVASIGGAIVHSAISRANVYSVGIPYAFWLPLTGMYGVEMFSMVHQDESISHAISRTHPDWMEEDELLSEDKDGLYGKQNSPTSSFPQSSVLYGNRPIHGSSPLAVPPAALRVPTATNQPFPLGGTNRAVAI